MELKFDLGYKNKYGRNIAVARPGDLIHGVEAEVKVEGKGGALAGHTVTVTTGPMAENDRLVLRYWDSDTNEFWVYNAQGERIGTFERKKSRKGPQASRKEVRGVFPRAVEAPWSRLACNPGNCAARRH